MNEKEYKDFIQLCTKFKQELFHCAQEICQISKSRDLIGIWDRDVDEHEGYYRVTCESYYCGDTDYDSVDVPIQYIYDKVYRVECKKVLIKDRERAEEMVREREESRKRNTYRVIVDERAEYERLKAKFGD